MINFIDNLEQHHLVRLIVMYTSILHWSFQICSHIHPKSFDAGLILFITIARYIKVRIVDADDLIFFSTRPTSSHHKAGKYSVIPDLNFWLVMSKVQHGVCPKRKHYT